MRYSFFVWLGLCVALAHQGLQHLSQSQMQPAVVYLGGALLASAGVVRGFVEGVFGPHRRPAPDPRLTASR